VLNEAQNIGTILLDEVKPLRAGKTPLTLAQAMRKAGGISIKNNGGFRGEIEGMRGDFKNLVRVNGGLSPAQMSERMHEAGYIENADINTLLNAVRDEATGLPQNSLLDDMNRQWSAMKEAGMGDAPEAVRQPVAVPFDQLQRLRRDSGGLAARAAEDASRGPESKVLSDFERAISARIDDAASGNLAYDEVMPQSFRDKYVNVRDMTRTNKERYAQSNNIGSILRKPVGQDYTLTGDEIFNKLWHGGSGLSGDVSNLKSVLSTNNAPSAMGVLQRAILTEAAGKTTASGQFGAALPKYVEQRMPGLLEAMEPEQLKGLLDVATDIRNAEAAAAVPGLRGSDTQAKISRALDAGLFDSQIAKTLAKVTSLKGIGGEFLRSKAAEAVVQYKGKTIAKLLADPKAAAAALADPAFTSSLDRLDRPAVEALRLVAARAAPVLAAD
jgi:hypothetical protein